jgi:hypothetical protein
MRRSLFEKQSNVLFWWLGAVETPVLIPNTAVKHRSGDGTGLCPGE